MKNLVRICPDCNIELVYNHTSSYYNAVRRNSTCKKCRTIKSNKSTKRNGKKSLNPAWKGYKGVGYVWFSGYFERRKRHLKGDITIEYCYEVLERQDFKCALTGIPLLWDQKSGMSIDRINSKRGYYKDNIQIVHKDVNLMKNHFDQDYFIKMCKLITNNK